jgi:hypothetical protein
MLKRLTLILLLLTSSHARAADVLTLTAEELAKRPAICLIPEMALVPEADGWPACEPSAYADSTAAFAAEWSKLAPWLAQKLTPAAARALSRWSAPQMEKYAAVPPLDKLKFTPVAAIKPRGVILYQATIDRLPTHSPLVTRELIAYVCYSPDSRSISHLTITIRGHVEE